MKKDSLSKMKNFKNYEIQESEKIKGGKGGSRLSLMATCTPDGGNPNDPDLYDNVCNPGN